MSDETLILKQILTLILKQVQDDTDDTGDALILKQVQDDPLILKQVQDDRSG
ncbi:MAG: hypothetical protein PHR79_01835 [Bacteroidales bacterium]|nr:hypothetical protein [Bacteroidales bacterium]